MGIITPSVSGLGLFVLRSIFWLCSALHGKRLTLQLHSSVSWPVGGTNARMEGRKKRDTRVISPQSCCPGWHSRSSCVSSVVLVPSELWEFYLLPFHINRKVPHHPLHLSSCITCVINSLPYILCYQFSILNPFCYKYIEGFFFLLGFCPVYLFHSVPIRTSGNYRHEASGTVPGE